MTAPCGTWTFPAAARPAASAGFGGDTAFAGAAGNDGTARVDVVGVVVVAGGAACETGGWLTCGGCGVGGSCGTLPPSPVMLIVKLGCVRFCARSSTGGAESVTGCGLIVVCPLALTSTFA